MWKYSNALKLFEEGVRLKATTFADLWIASSHSPGSLNPQIIARFHHAAMNYLSKYSLPGQKTKFWMVIFLAEALCQVV
ncbi:MAG: hypothetical protein COW22_04660 [Chloroflexi bacterium CG15_BIG_FIL_POST_REV_8_21_14_020_46_15]|nr:MAG: hypothetical protein COW22_04660 [Chloroflexi bacterium CG15_BIG_FIL_POST_REV_8_21_14_020_46_15]